MDFLITIHLDLSRFIAFQISFIPFVIYQSEFRNIVKLQSIYYTRLAVLPFLVKYLSVVFVGWVEHNLVYSLIFVPILVFSLGARPKLNNIFVLF